MAIPKLRLYQSALAKGNIGLANELRLKYFAKAVAKSLTIPGWNLVAFAVGYYLGYLACSAFVNNDDGIGDRNGFEDIVNTAINNSGTYYVWQTWAWKIKLVAD